MLLLFTTLAVAQPLEAPVPLEAENTLAKTSTAGAGLRDVTVEIDSAPGAKKNQSVWLVSTDGSKVLISYQPTPLWRLYAGHRVHVTGTYYTPEGPQALGAQHFRVGTLLVADQQGMADPIAFGDVQEYAGTWGLEHGVPGSKSQGSSWPTFSHAGGLTYQIMNPPKAKDRPPGQVTIRARAVERSPFVAHRGGPTLWVVD